jgi:6-phosphofructokinase
MKAQFKHPILKMERVCISVQETADVAFVTYLEHLENAKTLWFDSINNTMELEPKSEDIALLPIFQFQSEAELKELKDYIEEQKAAGDADARLTCRDFEKKEGSVSGQDLLRMIGIGTHRVEYITEAKMTHKNSRLELTHVNEKFHVRCDIGAANIGKKLRAYYKDKLDTIGAGGHKKEAEEEG